MTDKVDEFIKASLLKDKEVLVGIFQDIVKNHPGETLRQHAIRAAIMQFERQYPKMMDEFDHAIARKKELLNNEYGSNDEIDLRVEFAIPDGLEARIKLVLEKTNQPLRFLSDEAEKAFQEKEWFHKSFPRYVVPAKF